MLFECTLSNWMVVYTVNFWFPLWLICNIYGFIPWIEIWKTVWILISWLLMKPADLDPHCFSKEGTITEWNWILNVCLIHLLLQGWVSASDSVKRESFTVEKLRPNTTYMFLIRAKNAQGVGLPSLVSDPVTTASKSITFFMGAQWLSGRVLDSRQRGRGFEPHRRHCVVVLEQDTA